METRSKICSECGIDKPFSEYYGVPNKNQQKRCKTCWKIRLKEAQDEKLADNCGNPHVPMYPNVYEDKYQRECTFQLLEALGYMYNNFNGIWFKEPHKTRDGKFPTIDRPKKEKKPRKNGLTKETIDLIIKYKKEGMRTVIISEKTKVSCSTINNYWNIYEAGQNRGSGNSA